MKTMAGGLLSVIARAFFSCLVLKVARRPKTLRMPMFSWFHGAKTWFFEKNPCLCFFGVIFACMRCFNAKCCCPQSNLVKNGVMGSPIPSLNALRSTVLLGRMLSTRKRRGAAVQGLWKGFVLVGLLGGLRFRVQGSEYRIDECLLPG